MAVPDPRRAVPRTDVVLADQRLQPAITQLGTARVKAAVRSAQEAVRRQELPAGLVVDSVLAALSSAPGSMRQVINATGIVLHTNLGRAPLSSAAIQAIGEVAAYVDVEYDLSTGRRAKRGRGTLAALRSAVPAAEDVLVVNNGAAALLLAVTTLARGRSAAGRVGDSAGSAGSAQDEVIMSRGELVEIGDGFRLPELISAAGARIVEVGTTNRTNRADYQRALSESTGCIVKVHPSNFRIEGFTAEVTVAELAALSGDVPVVVDIGSGLLVPDVLFPAEPDVTSTLIAGADLVLCSGDKLLGGPQSGLLFGRAELIERLRRDPLARALRVDKLTLAALEASVSGPPTPTARYLRADPDTLRMRATALAGGLPSELGALVVEVSGAVGGGGAPGVELPGWALSLPAGYAERLRAGRPPVVGRVEAGRCLLDLRCVDGEQDALVLQAILDAGGFA
ncbi:MAG: L-seryl-tRNA(Sec) selenium transferase [Frankiales bacterium]|nr:L-seryl-tRNA(Sec) selenium transferase [Frankiales bacterium]